MRISDWSSDVCSSDLKIEPAVSSLISWKDPSERIGFLVGATYQERTNRSLSASGDSWHWWTDDKSTNPAVDVNGNPFANDDAISYWNSGNRSEEHTSELQSLMRTSYAVFCLKKKQPERNHTLHISKHQQPPSRPTVSQTK